MKRLTQKQINDLRQTKESAAAARENMSKLGKEGKHEEAEKAYKEWQTYAHQFGNIVEILTSHSGYWYVGKTKTEIEEKLKSLPPEKLQEVRNKVADLLKLSREADKFMTDVKKKAQELLESIK